MSCFHLIRSHNQCLVKNSLQLCLQQVLATNAVRSGLPSIALNCLQRRDMAARRGKRIAAAREKQKQSRIKKEEARNAPPKVWTPTKLKIDKSALNVGPRRFTDEHLKDLDSLMDDIYITKLYKQKAYSLVETLDMHRETHHKTILNEPNALVETTIELDLRTKKKTKFCDTFKGIMSFPNKFPFKVNRRIIAICKKEEDKHDAKEAGADVVGGVEIIKMLQKGDLSMSHFDDLVCHGDLLVELAAIRGLLMHAFPTKLRGNLGFDMKKLVNQFVTGIEYKLVKDDLELDYGWVRLPFGRFDMDKQQLEQNFRFVLSTIEKHKPSTSLVPFITRVLIQSESSKEEFATKFADYIEGYDEESDEEMDDNDSKQDVKELSSL